MRKVDNAVAFSTSVQDGSCQANSIVQYGKIYIAAMDFWHQGLVQTSTCFRSNAKSRYQDGSMHP